MANYNIRNLTNDIQTGNVNFKINKAVDDKILLKSEEEKDVLSLNVTIDDDNGNESTINPYLIFIDQRQMSQFGQFLTAASVALGTEDITPEDLNGLTGKAKYFIKKNNFPGLNDWQFDIPSNRSNQMLQQHINNQQIINNEAQMNQINPWVNAEGDD
ncbi:hypothetical protein AB6G96_12315 [Staphylococcus haemolyticus]|uniref:hypothetical protein n=1 Tax=Staphylococcus TaxID=1279 RepID=UPI00069DAD97|nr:MULTISPECIES: hypothetical protein [Staphylococcus]AYX83924.1 hypothetical protein EGX85_06165 [Staphylococcus haemolyticus]MBE7296387.1 hypothetical protein [Staphylococcus haemolyticus]MBW5899385.1 hypothetical protein [Staphylococcus haemolyticus]MCH4363452.1 hypothetical protein [Staphylococcus haemolyticus]MCH4386484.1 hypothetical protein [Staphylococcus haemolyticus]